MRLLLSFYFFAAISIFVAPVYADERDKIDTGQGLTYEKPSGWTETPNKKGTASALVAAGDDTSQIELRYAKIEGEQARNYFATFHTSLSKAKLQRVGEGTEKKFGKLEGVLTEYSTGEGAKQKVLFVFEFSTSGGVWLVVGMFDARQRDEHLKSYEGLLASVVAE